MFNLNSIIITVIKLNCFNILINLTVILYVISSCYGASLNDPLPRLRRSNQFSSSINAVSSSSSSSSTPARKLPPLLWHSSNPLFISNNRNDHTIRDAEKSNNNYLTLTAHLGDSLDLLCPKQNGGEGGVGVGNDNDIEYSQIYRVGSRYEFDNCLVDLTSTSSRSQPLFKCDQRRQKFTLYFVKYSPVPYAMEFNENEEYYFLSTSNGRKSGLYYAQGGLCSQFNMKFSIKIEPNQQFDKSQLNYLSSHQSNNNNNRNQTKQTKSVIDVSPRPQKQVSNSQMDFGKALSVSSSSSSSSSLLSSTNYQIKQKLILTAITIFFIYSF
jgi:hypothetical protein